MLDMTKISCPPLLPGKVRDQAPRLGLMISYIVRCERLSIPVVILTLSESFKVIPLTVRTTR